MIVGGCAFGGSDLLDVTCKHPGPKAGVFGESVSSNFVVAVVIVKDAMAAGLDR